MLGNRKVLIDTCIIIEYLKGNIELEPRECYINSVILMELYIGVKNKQELRALKKQLQGFKLLSINQNIMNLATQIIDNYALSHSAKIQDAMIASTALVHNIPLATINIKDFRYISNLEIARP